MCKKIKISVHFILFVISCFLVSGCQINENVASDNMNKNTNDNNESFLVGTYTKNGSEGIYRLTLNHQQQTLTNIGPVASAINPSYLTFDQDPNNVFAVTNDEKGGISLFTWDNNKQEYRLKSAIDGLGKGACHIAINPTYSQLAIANYTSGEVHLISRDLIDDKLALIGQFKNKGKGLTARQEAPHMHFVQWDNSGKYLYAVDLGTDEIKYFDSSDSKFQAKIAANLQLGDGPRHFSFHPQQAMVYVLNELSNSIVAFKHDMSTGKFSELARYPATLDNQNSPLPSAIRISKDGNFLYAAIRGKNQISVFRILKTGELAFIQSHSSGGETPRDFNFSKNQNYILVANKSSNSIDVLARDSQTGLLSLTKMEVSVSTPSFISTLEFDK